MAKSTSTHRKIAERALGKPLPPGAEVHHLNGDRRDNRPCNLVICQNARYHDLLHERMRARGIRKPAGVPILYIIRGIDDDLWKRVKVQAATDGKPIRTVILEMLAEYAK